MKKESKNQKPMALESFMGGLLVLLTAVIMAAVFGWLVDLIINNLINSK